MDVREKLVELIKDGIRKGLKAKGDDRLDYSFEDVADYLVSNGVTVQEHGYWETVVEVRDNTVCGNGVKIEYKRCSCCKNPSTFLENDFCGHCGAKLDLPKPPKGE